MSKRLVYVAFDEAADGAFYITEMKHGWIEGQYDALRGTCSGYYWTDIEWYPEALYRIEDEIAHD